jgi:hypothetical protein
MARPLLSTLWFRADPTDSGPAEEAHRNDRPGELGERDPAFPDQRALDPAASLDSRSDEGRRPSTIAFRPRTASGIDPIPSSRRSAPPPRESEALVPGREWDRVRTDRPGAPHEACFVGVEIVIHLGRVHHQQPAAMRCQSGSHVLGPEAGEAISVLDHDRGHGLVTKERQELASLPVQGRPPSRSRPGQPPSRSSRPRPSLAPSADHDGCRLRRRERQPAGEIALRVGTGPGRPGDHGGPATAPPLPAPSTTADLRTPVPGIGAKPGTSTRSARGRAPSQRDAASAASRGAGPTTIAGDRSWRGFSGDRVPPPGWPPARRLSPRRAATRPSLPVRPGRSASAPSCG